MFMRELDETASRKFIKNLSAATLGPAIASVSISVSAVELLGGSK